MKMYIPITVSLLCMAVMAVECYALKRMKGLTAERLEPVAIVGTMDNTVKLPGYLESPTQPFYEDNQERHGQADTSYSNVQLATSARPTTATTTRNPMMVMPDLKVLEDVKTHAKLLNASDSTLCFGWFVYNDSTSLCFQLTLSLSLQIYSN